MTAIVGIRCKDVVVIGADSSATFGDGYLLAPDGEPIPTIIAKRATPERANLVLRQHILRRIAQA